MLLAGDIGGTKTSLAVYSPEAGPRAPVAQSTFPSGSYPSLETIVQEFLERVKLPIERASFGVAGPVVAGKAKITNLPWTIEESRLKDALDLESVTLLNDLEAIAHGIPFLQPVDLYTLNEGRPQPGGALAVVAPGTGLGEAFLVWEGTRYRVHPSEGGHVDFGPADSLQVELVRFLRRRYDHVSYERVCSGRGLPNLYAFLKESGHAPEPAWLAKRLAAASDPAPVIVNAALEDTEGCELCTATLNLFVSILGAEAGNMTLKVMATGGVFLGGGIPPRILPMLEGGRFMQAFRHKGRFVELLENVPVHVIRNPALALFGAACHVLDATPDGEGGTFIEEMRADNMRR